VTYPNGQQPQYQPPPAQQQVQAPTTNKPQQPQAQPAKPSVPGQFSARFLDKRDGSPIEGLEVTIVGTGQKATTDADGKVAFTNVPANAQYETYHNDFVQAKGDIPGSGLAGLDVPLTAMADFM
jgi:hypothetical protein